MPASSPSPSGRRAVRATQPLSIAFGPPANYRGDEIVWDSRTAINGHVLVAGPSGSGKSHQLNRIIRTLAEQGLPRLIVINPHGDLCLDLPDRLCQTIRFHEQSAYGLNPLEVLDDPEIGGVRRRANAFINLLARQGALGPRQKAALYRLLIEGYARFGFLADEPRSWALDHDPRGGGRAKRHPILTDVKDALKRRLVMMKTGQSEAAVRAFEDVIRMTARRAALRKRRAKSTDDQDLAALEDKLEAARKRAADAYSAGIESMDQGDELEELLLWENADSLAALHDRLESLERAGIFKGAPPPFDPAVPVWNYDIRALADDEQEMFVDCLLERVYLDAKRRGDADGVDAVVVIDESHRFVVEEGDHVINRLVKESRKWGVGMVMASQAFMHFSEDLLMSASVKLVLGCPDIYREPMRRKLGLDMVELNGKKHNPLAFIRPQETALISVSSRGKTSPMTTIKIRA